MGTDISLWRVDGDSLSRVESQGIPLESQLEDLIEKDPSVLGERVLVIGRQVRTDLDGRIDLLGVGDDGTVHVIELKRGRTPRDSVAQLLAYGAWANRLTHHDIIDLYQRENPGQTFNDAFSRTFGTDTPTELNSEHRLTLVAHSSSAAVENTVEYLAAHGVPIAIMLFSFFTDGENRYLARTLVSDDASSTAPARPGGTREPWNKRDWYVSFGEQHGSRNWEDALRYGFVSAGAGA
ncbi:endonuclease NucS [Nocardiopsis exhalans]|uniref:Endonuclease NucS n=1 Tax=Nocardiopsis exhalans TaxID=163604 RepID=A0ABY5CZS1_9ACTN|nr:endonuclease NucS domain-containing protein [Nocardiopsis exhalans]USY17447.1 endonuclease NucS [Nocardiopsis exhalans]